jgi:uncharacterized membrane protein YjgN (DUF898 family)
MENKTYALAFHGRGSQLFKIQIVNFILSIITLGLYYPWAKAKTLQYLYSQNTLEQEPFAFTGTGAEMFKGFIKALACLLVVYGITIGLIVSGSTWTGVLFFYLCFMIIAPLAIHGSYKYRMAKTVWRGIRFGYVGDRSQLIRIFLRGVLLTVCTLGIYGAWFAMDLRRYIFSNIRIGDAEFTYYGQGDDYFWMNLRDYFLTIFTLGIYYFWWQKDQFNFFVNNLRLQQDDKAVFFHSKATGVGFAGLTIVNLIILVFTLGLGFPWVITRTLNFVANNIEMNGNVSFDQLQQAQSQYSDATGEDMSDFFDFGFVI